VNKTAASAAQLAKSSLLHAYSCAREQTKTSYSLFNKLANSIFGYKLRTD